ncbi:hemin receptor [Amaricoccus sp. HAR-UPW-R2A-40]|nr:hemin receptor [Amaricoccus sp. HAR-UPW-R2A-40]
MRLSEREADLIRASFRAIAADAPNAAGAFYGHLFEIAPHTRRMFVKDVNRQGAKLVATLGFVVAEMDAWVNVAPLVEELALRHLAYGVLPDDYRLVGLALQAMLSATLGSACTSETSAAWARLYDALQSQMTAAAYDLPALHHSSG